MTSSSSQSFNNWMSFVECSWILYHADTPNFIFPFLLLPIDYHGVRPLANADRQDFQVRICCVVYSHALE
jgi:hypothetical protein